MFLLHRREGAAQIRRWITLRAAGCDRVPEYLAADLVNAVRGLQSPAGFNFPQHGQKFRGGNPVSWPAAGRRKYVALQSSDNRSRVSRYPIRRIFVKPLARYCFEIAGRVAR